MVHQGISPWVLRGTTYDPGHWTFYFCRRGFGLVVSVIVPLMLAVLPYARGHGFNSLSRLLFIVWTNLCFSSFVCSISGIESTWHHPRHHPIVCCPDIIHDVTQQSVVRNHWGHVNLVDDQVPCSSVVLPVPLYCKIRSQLTTLTAEVLAFWILDLATRWRQLWYWPPLSPTDIDRPLWSHSSPRGNVINTSGATTGSENGDL
jgi:hypothetical protein